MSEVLLSYAQRAAHPLPRGLDWSVRVVEEQAQTVACRQNVLLPLENRLDLGLMLWVADGTGIGYAATDDLSDAGFAALRKRALGWMRATAGAGLAGTAALPEVTSAGHASYDGLSARTADDPDLAERLAMVRTACASLKIHADIVDWSAQLTQRRVRSVLVDSRGTARAQYFRFVLPGMSALACRGSESQQRTGGGVRRERQGGLGQLGELGFPEHGPRIAEEALALLDAPQCPRGQRDLVLMPGQMVLQIHESIGHPLELDRILGDERNFAGGSFVTPDMFGSYAYGSELLNVVFDPGRPEQIASYGFDDEGALAERAYLIRDGVLQRPLGGTSSQARAGLPGVACARAAGWQRPPIDRMANLNLEPGESSLQDMIGGIERGVLMDSNRSWSIDDTRDKFQFGCEYGRLIEDGELHGLVRNPGYRGHSARFWRSLDAVGDPASVEVGGVTRCGKGEPNQLIAVGHASPPCRFRDVDVFGGLD